VTLFFSGKDHLRRDLGHQRGGQPHLGDTASGVTSEAETASKFSDLQNFQTPVWFLRLKRIGPDWAFTTKAKNLSPRGPGFWAKPAVQCLSPQTRPGPQKPNPAVLRPSLTQAHILQARPGPRRNKIIVRAQRPVFWQRSSSLNFKNYKS
jgi:hypothetical protein